MFEFQGTSLPEAIQEWVKKHPEHSALDEAAIDRFISEEWEGLTIYPSDIISTWIAFGSPTCNTKGFMEEHSDIIDAIRTEAMYAFTAEAYNWCSEYMGQLREGL